MKKIILFFLLTNFLFPKISHSCTCAPLETFCESIIGPNGDIFANLLIRGKITETTSQGKKKIKINQLIHGAFNQSEILLSADFCTLYFNELKDGEEYLFAMFVDDNDLAFLIGCGVSFLKIEDGVVKGKIAPGIESVDYADLGDLDGCGSAFDLLSLEKNIAVFPNPTLGELKIENLSPRFSVENLQLKIFDSIGRELSMFRNEEGILPEEVWEIDIQNFPAGVYLFKFSNINLNGYYKIVKL